MIAETIANTTGTVAGKCIEAHANIKTEQIKSSASVAEKAIDATASTINKAADAFQMTQEDIEFLKAYTEPLRYWQETIKDSEEFSDKEKCEQFAKIFEKAQEQEDRSGESRSRKIQDVLKGIACAACGLGVAALSICASIFLLKKPLSVVRVPGFLLGPVGKLLKNLIV